MTQAAIQADSDMGQYAAQVLDNPAYQAAWARMEADIVSAWSECPVADTDSQQLILQQMKLLKRLRASFTGMVEQGKYAAAELVRKADSDLKKKDPVALSPIEREFSRVRQLRRAR